MNEITWRKALSLIDKGLIEKAVLLPNSKKKTKKDKLFFVVNGENYPAKRTARAAWSLKESGVLVKWNGAGGTKQLEEFYHRLGYKTLRIGGDFSDSKTVQTLHQKACEAISEYVDEHGITKETLSRSDVLKIVCAKYSEIDSKGNNMSPSDICYNRCNGRDIPKKFPSWPHALEYVGYSQYRLLGLDYPYTGEVIWDKEKKGEIVFGEWFNGVFSQYDASDRVTIEESAEQKREFIEETESIINTLAEDGFDRDIIAKARVNQDKFRNRLLNRYGGCCLCGISNTDLLIASHIKPWSVSLGHEKTDVNNGLLLCPHHDKLFDQGYISFDDTGVIMISDHLNIHDRILTNVQEGDSIEVCGNNLPYLEYHRNHKYKG